jgi:hypothetical protein
MDVGTVVALVVAVTGWSSELPDCLPKFGAGGSADERTVATNWLLTIIPFPRFAQDIRSPEHTANRVSLCVSLFSVIGCAFGVFGAANNAENASSPPSPVGPKLLIFHSLGGDGGIRTLDTAVNRITV